MRSSSVVTAAAEAHQATAEQAIAAEFGPEAGAAAATLMRVLGNNLTAKTNAMAAADDAHASELADDAGPRAAREESVGQLRDVLVTMKEELQVTAGYAYVKLIKADGETPSDPVQMERFATGVQDALLNTPVPPSRLAGYTVNPQAYAASLTAPLQALRGALKDTRLENEQAEQTQSVRNRATAEYDRTFPRTANVISALLALGGLEELARKVRPSPRRPGVTEEEPVVTPS